MERDTRHDNDKHKKHCSYEIPPSSLSYVRSSRWLYGSYKQDEEKRSIEKVGRIIKPKYLYRKMDESDESKWSHEDIPRAKYQKYRKNTKNPKKEEKSYDSSLDIGI